MAEAPRLAARFWSHYQGMAAGRSSTEPPQAAAGEGPDLAHWEAALRAVLAVGKAAWPGLDLDEERFVRFLAELDLGERGAPDEAQLTRAAADLYLACACAQGLPAALTALEQRYISRVGEYISGLRPSPALVDEAKQSLRVRLLHGGSASESKPKIAQYSGRGSLDSFVCATALRCALTLLRKESVALGGARAEPAALVDTLDPELEFLKRKHQDVFADCLRSALADLPAESRNLLRLHHVEQLTMIQIARIYGKHRTTVSRWLEEAHQAALNGIRERLRQRLHVSPTEFDSLLRVVWSRIDVSIRTLLAPASDSG